MKIIIGLGNPGAEYAGTRHNAGLLLVDQIFNYQFSIFNDSYGWRRKKDIMTAEFPDIVLVKTAGVFMNESGKIIAELKQGGYINNSPLHPSLNLREGTGKGYDGLFLAHDDLDIKLGEYKIQFGTGPKVHNGVLAVERALGTKEFWRIRIGIDNRITPIDGETYVLQRFNKEEKGIIDQIMLKITNDILNNAP
jgi:PTH1 family peptidyl-tRNA hydrolase